MLKVLSFYFTLLCSISFLQAQQIPEPMRPPRLVNDFVHKLSDREYAALEAKLEAYNDTTSTEIAVVIVSSIEGYDPVDYAQRLGEKWGVGKKQDRKNNGIVVLVSIEDRKAAIATGYGMEGSIPDIVTREIRENYMNPNFRAGNFYAGLDQATTAIIQYAAGEYKGTGRTSKDNNANGFKWGGIIFLVVFYLIVRVIGAIGRTRRNHYGKKVDFWTAFWLMNSMGGRGRGGSNWGGNDGGGFGGGGGGFGGFGGGSFGGGGSGGSW